MSMPIARNIKSPRRANAGRIQNTELSAGKDAAVPSAVKAAPETAPKPHGRSISVSEIASRLGRMARGKPKKLSPQELKRRTLQLLKAAKAYRARLKKQRKTRR